MKNKVNTIECVLIFTFVAMVSCAKEPTNSNEKLEVVTHDQFNEFVKKTGYITDAEKFGWSIVQTDVFNFHKVEGANWKKPDGKDEPKSSDLPVTQVSYNDAMAYCKWSGSRLPSYEEY
ncbi:MAG: SUMF1/EgtB/PvdO family nonheme iron enzyme, partial [Cytophagales bacterium]